MSLRAWLFISGVFGAGIILAASSFADPDIGSADLGMFAAFLILATIAQIAKVEAPNHTLYYATTVFTFAGLLLLPPAFYVLLVALPHLIEWGKERLLKSAHLRLWYLQPFNIANNTVNGIIALLAYNALNPSGSLYQDSRAVLAALSAACVYLMLNRLILGMALILARGLTWRTSNVFDLPNLMAELVLLMLGFVVAIAWTLNPLLLAPALAPLLVMYQALRIPQLQQEARLDPKTGIFNARHFQQRYSEEFARARRFERPLSVIMVDLDYLRTINNTYGHVAGDAVIAGIGKLIRQTAREYDIAARFGGEEFAIVLPETEQLSALTMAERIRLAVADARFETPTQAEPLLATVSLGIATFPYDGATPEELLHNADVALYHAKLLNRNRTVCFADIPHSVDHVTELTNLASEPDPIADQTTEPEAGAPQTPATPPAATTGADTPPNHAESVAKPSRFLWPFVGTVVITGGFLTLAGTAYFPIAPLPILLAILIAAAVAELFQVDLYGQGTISVTVAVIIGAAAIAGPLGLALASAACAISAALVMQHSTGRRPQIHKTLFNWANHVIAGFLPAIGFELLNLPISIAALPSLILPTLAFALIYYFIETGFVAAAISLSTGQPILREWRDRYRWLANTYLTLASLGILLVATYVEIGLIGVTVMILPIAVMRYSQKQYIDRTSASMREFERLNRELSRANTEIRQASREIGHLNDELFETLARFFDARDPYVGEHAITVADYASAIGRELGWPEARLKQLRQAALLHDIGKIAIPESILHKPGRLTDEEYKFIQSHAEIGATLIAQSQGLRHLAPFVRHHHEHWDGRGYPEGLAGEKIPIQARIISICDAVEAMASDRPYRQGMSPEQIIAEIDRCAGTQFDPRLTAIFIKLARQNNGIVIVNSARGVAHRQSSATPRDHTGLRRLAFSRAIKY